MVIHLLVLPSTLKTRDKTHRLFKIKKKKTVGQRRLDENDIKGVDQFLKNAFRVALGQDTSSWTSDIWDKTSTSICRFVLFAHPASAAPRHYFPCWTCWISIVLPSLPAE